MRFQKMRGHECHYVCADDAHGTPVMLRAESENITPEELIDKMQKAHMLDLAGFDIGFDNYHSTHSDENRRLSEDMFIRLRNKGCIVEREIEQLYDPQKNMFLPTAMCAVIVRVVIPPTSPAILAKTAAPRIRPRN